MQQQTPICSTGSLFKLDQTNLLLSRVPCQRLEGPSDSLTLKRGDSKNTRNTRAGWLQQVVKAEGRRADERLVSGSNEGPSAAQKRSARHKLNGC